MPIYLFIWETRSPDSAQVHAQTKMQKTKEQNPKEHSGSQGAAQAELRLLLSLFSQTPTGPQLLRTLQISGIVLPEAEHTLVPSTATNPSGSSTSLG